MLNETLRNSESAFYSSFKEDKHCDYTAADNIEYINSIGVDHRNKKDRDCLWDADLDLNEPLRFSADWGASINCLIVYQRKGRMVRILNAFFVKSPQILDDVFIMAAHYYRHHKHKHVLLHYDRTGNNAKDNSTITSAQQASRILMDRGFSVSLMTKGRAPAHAVKYLLANKILLETDETLPVVRINPFRCKQLITSILLSSVVQGTTGEHKDKTAERDPNYPQEDATHFSDAFDIILEAEGTLNGALHYNDIRVV